MIVRILGLIDLIAAISFLMLIFGIDPFVQVLLFSAGLLFVKGLFVLGGDVLSFVDLFSSFVLILSIFFDVFSIFLWLPAFLLMAKGLISFL